MSGPKKLPDLPYFYGANAEQFAFYRIPKVFFTEPLLCGISIEAKLLYGLMLDRLSLSTRNDWVDADGRVYIYYTVENVMEDLNCGNKKAVKLLNELDSEYGLIERKRQGLGKPTKIYVKALRTVKEAGVDIKACSHITGGGFYENIPRMLPDGVKAVVEKDSYEIPAIFRLLAKTGNIEEKMMYNTYNMGIGMVLAVDPADADKAMEAARAAGENPYVIGRIEAGEKGVELC